MATVDQFLCRQEEYLMDLEEWHEWQQNEQAEMEKTERFTCVKFGRGGNGATDVCWYTFFREGWNEKMPSGDLAINEPDGWKKFAIDFFTDETTWAGMLGWLNRPDMLGKVYQSSSWAGALSFNVALPPLPVQACDDILARVYMDEVHEILDHDEAWHHYAKPDCPFCHGTGKCGGDWVPYGMGITQLPDEMCDCLDWAKIAEDGWILD